MNRNTKFFCDCSHENTKQHIHKKDMEMALLNKPGVPHKGWILLDVVDSRDEGLEYGCYGSCEFCGQEQVRFVHILRHPDYHRSIEVGCICSENLSDDYVNPRKRERSVRNRAARRVRFPTRKWKISLSGNHYLNDYKGYYVLAYQTSEGKFKAKINQEFGKKTYNSLREAKLGIFDAVEKMLKIQNKA